MPSVDHSKRVALAEHRRQLEREVPGVAAALETLRRADLALTRIEPARANPGGDKTPRAWYLYCEPALHLRERFDLAPELLVLLVPGHTTQARDLERCERQLLRDLRLDRGLILALTRDPRAGLHLEQAARATGRCYVFVTFEALGETPDPQRWLRDTLLEHLGSADLFAPGPPVFGWDFVGREGELASVGRHLARGRCIGLYGLRKIGKTSLLTVLRHRLVADARAGRPAARHRGITVPIHLDLQAISFAEQNRVGFSRRLLLSIKSGLEALALRPQALGLPDLRPRALREVEGSTLPALAVDALETLVDWAQRFDSRVVLVVDEYERLLSDQSFPVDQGIELFEYLRGLAQSHDAFAFVLAGLSRRLASAPRLADRRNPLFNFALDHPLAGLGRDEHNELFRKIGRRLSLTFEPTALARLWRETGGHPYLARELGRQIDRHVPIFERRPKRVDVALVEALLLSWRRSVRPTLEEIESTILDLDPEAPAVLAAVARATGTTSPAEIETLLGKLEESTLDELERLGILHWIDDRPKVRIGVVGSWLEANWPPLAPQEASEDATQAS